MKMFHHGKGRQIGDFSAIKTDFLDGIKSCPLYGIDMEVKANNELNCL